MPVDHPESEEPGQSTWPERVEQLVAGVADETIEAEEADAAFLELAAVQRSERNRLRQAMRGAKSVRDPIYPLINE